MLTPRNTSCLDLVTMTNNGECSSVMRIVDTKGISFNAPHVSTRIAPGSYTFPLGSLSKIRVKVERTRPENTNDLHYIIRLFSFGNGKSIFVHPQAEVHVCTYSPVTSPIQSRKAKIQQPKYPFIPIVSFFYKEADPLTLHHIWCFCYILFTFWPEQEFIALDTSRSEILPYWLLPLMASRIAGPWPETLGIKELQQYKSTVALSRSEFWQGAGPLEMGGWVPALDGQRLQVSYMDFQTSTDLSLLPWEMTRKLVPFYERYIAEFGETISFYMLTPNWIAGHDQPSLVLPTESFSFECNWDGEPFATVSTNRNEFHVNCNRNYIQDQSHQRVGTQSIIHVRFRVISLTEKFLFLINKKTMELSTKHDEDEENVELIKSLLQSGGHVDRVRYNVRLTLQYEEPCCHRELMIKFTRKRFFQTGFFSPLHKWKPDEPAAR